MSLSLPLSHSSFVSLHHIFQHSYLSPFTRIMSDNVTATYQSETNVAANAVAVMHIIRMEWGVSVIKMIITIYYYNSCDLAACASQHSWPLRWNWTDQWHTEETRIGSKMAEVNQTARMTALDRWTSNRYCALFDVCFFHWTRQRHFFQAFRTILDFVVYFSQFFADRAIDRIIQEEIERIC